MRKKHNRTTAAPAAPAVKTDNYVNCLSRLGIGAPNLATATQYKPMQMVTQTWQVLVDMYCQSWIVGKIVGAIPEDMIRSLLIPGVHQDVLSAHAQQDAVSFSDIQKDRLQLPVLRGCIRSCSLPVPGTAAAYYCDKKCRQQSPAG